MTFEQIQKVNSEISMIDLKGKNYAMVPERVTAFRKLYPDGFINTDIISNDGTTVLMKATAGYYENGVPVILGTGFAQEVRGKGMVNGTSHIENCETSAVGRALGMMGLGINGGGICSAEELVNAITAQNQMKEEVKAVCQPPIKTDQIETASKLPYNQTANFIMNEISDIQEILKLKTYAEARGKVFAWADELVKAKALKPFKWAEITLETAKEVFKAIRENCLTGDAA